MHNSGTEKKDIKPINKLILVLYTYRKGFVISNFIVGILGLIIAFNLPLWYRSTGLVLVQQESNTSSIASMIAQVAQFPTMLSSGDKVMQYMGLLTSQNVLDSIIEKYNLKELYKKQTKFHTYQAVKSHLSLEDRQDGTFSISYLVKENPELAAKIVNSFYAELNKLILKINRSKAVDYRTYLSQSYNVANQRLENLLEEFREFQDSTGIVSIEEQIKSSLLGLADLEARRLTNRIELEYAQKTLGEDDPTVLSIEQRLDAIAREIHKYRTSGEYSNIPIISIPEASISYMNHYRTVEVQVKVVEYLALQLEQAKLEEQKQSANLYLVNPAQPADYKSEPKRLNVLITILFFFNVAFMLYYLIKDYYSRNKSELTTILHS
ncbi:MAG: hypothetical protein K9N11_03080 [Lentisphaeria bacterium]|nr:hypothetical protein [Lentisphaeria bacterium]